MSAALRPLPTAVAVMTPPQSVAFSSLLVSQTTKASACISSSILVRKVISPVIFTLGALFTVKAMPATVRSGRSGMSWPMPWSRRACSRSTSLIAPV